MGSLKAVLSKPRTLDNIRLKYICWSESADGLNLQTQTGFCRLRTPGTRLQIRSTCLQTKLMWLQTRTQNVVSADSDTPSADSDALSADEAPRLQTRRISGISRVCGEVMALASHTTYLSKSEKSGD